MRLRIPKFDLRLYAQALSLLLLSLCLLNPTVKFRREIFNYLFVVDITQSMNASDYHLAGLPSDRLSFVKHSIQHALQNLPCHSKVSIGVFTTKNMFLLFEPLELCNHYANIETSLMQIDWRMAWAANSHIARGLYTSIRDASKLKDKPSLIFFSDGQQTPAAVKEPPYILEPGVVPGIIFGVGQLQGVPVPKLDRYNIKQGIWQASEVNSASGNLPNATDQAGPYLSAVQEQELKRLAGITGLQYEHLDSPQQFSKALLTSGLGQQRLVDENINWMLAGSALLLLLLPYLRFFRVTR